ncbi:peptidyl-prolyl cis-trans isomerase CYP21-3, mitochondrial-like [Hibiscus syriacus]|uniref:peptidyl-prolyl cis-trans isomerase CYP21-3, mitochondrial-like n=1 Tax=Hibiscus syriacus TaxID=106335 RepID=UPI0019221F2A|nr:peptidyl-prolyl cis-trans isomerase CYP21-3, mitochondrial-like [Hibiscus syriacus]
MARIKPQALLQQSKRKKGPSRISLTTIIMSTLIVILIVFFVYASYRHWTQRSRIHIENKKSVIEGDNSFMDSKKSDLPGYAILDTSKGSITVELFKDSSPEVVDQFLDLCQRGRFNGMLFRLVIKHYVIQASDSDKLGAVEGWTLKGKQYNQLDTSLKHEAFMLGTSKAKHEDKEFELFITTAPIPDLNEKLIVFGKVTKGEDIVQEIEEVDTDELYRPKSSIEIRSVTLKQSI